MLHHHRDQTDALRRDVYLPVDCSISINKQPVRSCWSVAALREHKARSVSCVLLIKRFAWRSSFRRVQRCWHHYRISSLSSSLLSCPSPPPSYFSTSITLIVFFFLPVPHARYVCVCVCACAVFWSSTLVLWPSGQRKTPSMNASIW